MKRDKINGNAGNTNSKSQLKVTEGTEIHKETAMKKQKEHNMVLKLQISCNKKKSRFYSKTETALLSGRDRPRCLCILRLSGSEPETRRTGG